MKIFADEGETYFPEQISPEERAGLEAVAQNANRLSNGDLKNLIRIMGDLEAIDKQKQEESEHQQAIARHYEEQQRREIAQAARVAETERAVRRVRVARALGIPEDSPELENL
jgi:hypothetical protein